MTLTETATNVVQASTTNETGVFRFAALPPGQYTVKVALQNYKPVTVETFRVDAGAIRDLGKLTLVPGNLEETVEVKAEITPVQVSTSVRQAPLTADQLQNIQMKGRDIYGFLAVVPGVQDSNLSRDLTSWTSANNITINGAPVTSNSIMIDGIAQRDEYGTNAFVNPNIDAIGEVQVIANGYTAENGRSNGGLVNYVTKSGTGVFRGTGWYNARRDQWNANDYVNQQHNANFISNDTPEHNRIDYVYRIDVALSNKWRFNGKLLADQENNVRVNEFGPGVGRANNTVPAWQLSGTMTTLIRPTVVNELNVGFAINHYNQRGYPNDYDYTQNFCATIGVCPPRIAPYGTYYGFNPPP